MCFIQLSSFVLQRLRAKAVLEAVPPCDAQLRVDVDDVDGGSGVAAGVSILEICGGLWRV